MLMTVHLSFKQSFCAIFKIALVKPVTVPFLELRRPTTTFYDFMEPCLEQ